MYFVMTVLLIGVWRYCVRLWNDILNVRSMYESYAMSRIRDWEVHGDISYHISILRLSLLWIAMMFCRLTL